MKIREGRLTEHKKLSSVLHIKAFPGVADTTGHREGGSSMGGCQDGLAMGHLT